MLAYYPGLTAAPECNCMDIYLQTGHQSQCCRIARFHADTACTLFPDGGYGLTVRPYCDLPRYCKSLPDCSVDAQRPLCPLSDSCEISLLDHRSCRRTKSSREQIKQDPASYSLEGFQCSLQSFLSGLHSLCWNVMSSECTGLTLHSRLPAQRSGCAMSICFHPRAGRVIR